MSKMSWLVQNAETVGLIVSLLWNALLQSQKQGKK